MPQEQLTMFFQQHERYARLPLEYPGVRVVKDSMPSDVVGAYREVFGQGHAVKPNDGICYSLAIEVAQRHQVVVWPKATCAACAEVALAMLSAKRVFDSQCWFGSRLS